MDLVGKPKGKRSMGTLKCRWKDNIKFGIQEMGWWVDLIYLAQDREKWRALANKVVNFNIP